MAIEHGYTVPYAAAIKARVRKPVFVAGRINQPQIAEQVLTARHADMIGMTRALIFDPEMPNKARTGRIDDIRACIGCNQACAGHMHAGYSISCIQHPEIGRELTHANKPKVSRRRRILIAGGGPAGLKAAAVAAERGHDVTLYERGRQLGGQVLLAQLLPGRAEFGGLVTNLAHEARQSGAKVVTNIAVTSDLIRAEKPDAVTLGADKGFDAADFVMECREINVIPHIAQNLSGRRSTRVRRAIRTTPPANAHGSASRRSWPGSRPSPACARPGSAASSASDGPSPSPSLPTTSSASRSCWPAHEPEAHRATPRAARDAKRRLDQLRHHRPVGKSVGVGTFFNSLLAPSYQKCVKGR
jgi:hypothetical protein